MICPGGMRFLLALLLSVSALPAANPAADMKLTFSDDFEDGKLDPAKWVLVGDQVMVAFPKSGKATVLRLTSSSKRQTYVHTKGHFEQQYGYFEASMRLPSFNTRTSCHFTLLPVIDRIPGVELLWDFPGGDIVNSWARLNLSDGAHELRPEGKKSVKVLKPKESYEKFNTYGILWTEKAYAWFINGKKVFQADKQNVAMPLRISFDIKPDPPTSDKLKPQMLDDSVDIDWVKAWQ